MKNSPIHYISLPSGSSNTWFKDHVSRNSLGKNPGPKSPMLAQLSSALSTLAELPKMGIGKKVLANAKFSTNELTSSVANHKSKYRKGGVYKNSPILKPKVPFLINGKPHSPYVVKNKLKFNKKTNLSKGIIKTNEVSTDMKRI